MMNKRKHLKLVKKKYHIYRKKYLFDLMGKKAYGQKEVLYGSNNIRKTRKKLEWYRQIYKGSGYMIVMLERKNEW